MALRGHVFSKQLFSSDCFALFIDTFLGGESGVIKGLEITHDTSSVGLGTGYFCVQGRFLEEESGITFDVPATENLTYHILVCEIDLSKMNTATALNQAYYKTLSSTEDYPTLIQNNIGEGIYQFAFCRYTTNSTGLSNYRDLREYLDFDSIYTNVRTQMGYAIEDAEVDFDTWFNTFKNTSNTSFQTWMENTQTNFNEWFQTIQDVLDEDTAGHLLNLINNLEDEVNTELATKADKKKTHNITLPVANWTGTNVYTLTTDEEIDSEKTYYTRSGEEGAYVYEEVENPDVSEIGTYYEITGEEAPYTQTVTVEGILETDIVNMYPIYSDNLETRLTEKENYNKLSLLTSAANSVTVICDEEAPEVALNVRLEVLY